MNNPMVNVKFDLGPNVKVKLNFVNLKMTCCNLFGPYRRHSNVLFCLQPREPLFEEANGDVKFDSLKFDPGRNVMGM